MEIAPLLNALVLGVVEGLTEFLPISSTGHLIIVGSLLDLTDERSKVFKFVIQLAAILAVCWDYRARIARVAGGFRTDPVQRQFVGHILVAFLPAAVLGVMFHSTIKTYLFNPLTVDSCCSIITTATGCAPQTATPGRWKDTLPIT